MDKVTPTDFAALMRQHSLPGAGAGIALGCSGGPDSLALALLLRDWCAEQGYRLTALIINHGIRPEAAAEARAVASSLGDLGIEAIQLEAQWQGGGADIQNRARDLRFGLMLDWCRKHGIGDLFLAHHADDQAETFMLRLGRGSGVDGLAAMRRQVHRQGITIHRPLLDIPKERLLATVAAAGIEPVNDPSNQDRRFARVRMRAAMPGLAAEGLSRERLGATARRMARASDALDHYVMTLLDEAGRLYPMGYCRLEPAPLLAVPEEIALRALSRVLRAVSGGEHPPRMEKVENLYLRFRRERIAGGVTTSGCRVICKGGAVYICRELAAASTRLPVLGSVTWDRRFLLEHPEKNEKLEYGPLGAEGWALYRRRQPECRMPELPAAVFQVLPAVWRNDMLIDVPHLPPLPDAGKRAAVEIRFLPADFFAPSAFSSPLRHTI